MLEFEKEKLEKKVNQAKKEREFLDMLMDLMIVREEDPYRKSMLLLVRQTEKMVEKLIEIRDKFAPCNDEAEKPSQETMEKVREYLMLVEGGMDTFFQAIEGSNDALL